MIVVVMIAVIVRAVMMVAVAAKLAAMLAGGICAPFRLGANCTELVANALHDLVVTGGTADLIQQLYANALNFDRLLALGTS